MCATNGTVALLDIFASAYERAGGAHLDITPTDAMLVYLGVYTQDSILDVASSIVIDRLGRIRRELVMESRQKTSGALSPRCCLPAASTSCSRMRRLAVWGTWTTVLTRASLALTKPLGAGAARFLTPRP